ALVSLGEAVRVLWTGIDQLEVFLPILMVTGQPINLDASLLSIGGYGLNETSVEFEPGPIPKITNLKHGVQAKFFSVVGGSLDCVLRPVRVAQNQYLHFRNSLHSGRLRAPSMYALDGANGLKR